MQDMRDSTVKLCKEALMGQFARGDYKELIKLTLLYFQDEDAIFSRGLELDIRLAECPRSFML